MNTPVIAVVGSAMMDLTAYADVLPEAGQTLAGQLFTTGFGGKGANQAVMAARCGAQVHFIGKLGKDVFVNLKSNKSKTRLQAEIKLYVGVEQKYCLLLAAA